MGGMRQQAIADGAFDNVLPDGDFVLRIIKGNGKRKADGTPTIGLQLEVVRSEVTEDIGKKTWWNLYFTEKALPISFRNLSDLGLSDEFVDNSGEPQELADALVGVEFDAEVSHRNWGKNGENVSNNFKIVELVTPPAVGAGVDPSEAVSDFPEDEEPF